LNLVYGSFSALGQRIPKRLFPLPQNPKAKNWNNRKAQRTGGVVGGGGVFGWLDAYAGVMWV